MESYLSSPTSILNGVTWGDDLEPGFSDTVGANIKESTSSYFVNGYNGTFYIRTNSAINMSDYKYLKATVSCSTYNNVWIKGYLCISSSANYTNYVVTSAESSNSTSKSTLVCDISNISGMYYVYFKIVSTSIYQVLNIYSITLSNT